MRERRLPKVCIVTPSYPPEKCGIGDYAALLGEALALEGIEVTVLTSSDLGTPQRDANPHVLPVMKGRSLTDAMRLLKGIIKGEADIYHFQLGSTRYRLRLFFPFLFVPIAKLFSRHVRMVLTFHEFPPSSFTRHPFKAIVRFIRAYSCIIGADALVLVDETYKPQLGRLCRRVESMPCRVIPIASAIPHSRLSPEDLRHLRVRAGIPDEVLLLCFFGFVNRPKGFESVVEVLAMLRQRGVPAQLMVLGELSEGNPYHQSLRQKIERDGLAMFVHLLGFLDRVAVANYMAMSDVCILPFADGVHPKSSSFLAATAQGVLTITTSLERRGLDEAENVYYVAPGDIENMATAAQSLGGWRGGGRVPHGGTWREIAEEHIRLYTMLLRQEESSHLSSTLNGDVQEPGHTKR